MVREAGLEPACREAEDFKSSEYTDFSTLAIKLVVLPEGFEPSRFSPSDQSPELIRFRRTPVLGSIFLLQLHF